MGRPIVRCRCGHQVLAKEVLRTDLYERPRGRDYVYVKFRCRRCKRMGEAFVAENRWDWSILEPEHNEMSEEERDQFLDRDPISAAEVVEFHCRLKHTGRIVEETFASEAHREHRPHEGRAESRAEGRSEGRPEGRGIEARGIEGRNLSLDFRNGVERRGTPLPERLPESGAESGNRNLQSAGDEVLPGDAASPAT